MTATPWPVWPVTVTTDVDPSTATQCVVPGAQATGVGGKSPTNKVPGGVTAVHPGKLVGGTVVVVVLEVVVLEVVVLEVVALEVVLLDVVVLDVVVLDVGAVVDVGVVTVVVVPPTPMVGV